MLDSVEVQSPSRAMMQSLPAATPRVGDYNTSNNAMGGNSRYGGGKAPRLNPLLANSVSITSGAAVDKQGGKRLSDYLSSLPKVNQIKEGNSSRRNDALSQSMTISSRHSTEGKSNLFKNLGSTMT